MTEPAIRAIFFDAVGTLLFPSPSVAAIYARLAHQFGSRLTTDEIRSRFGPAFAREESRDEASGWRVDEPRESARWRAIVAEVLSDVTDPEGCFDSLWSAFASPTSWRVRDDAESALAELHKRGYTLGICSNFDGRLHGLLDAMPELALLRHRVVSSEIGWRKPAPEFYSTLCDVAGCTPGETLVVGDDERNDVVGPRVAGMRAVLLEGEARILEEVASAFSS